MSNEKMSLKGIMRKGDLHIVLSAKNHLMKCFDVDGKRLWTLPGRGYGVNGPGYEVQGGDTPPGLYKIGLITESQSNEPSSVWNAFGKYFCDLVELEGQEASRGRAGCGVHGGGSALINPLAPRQGWAATHGCVRMQNEDLEKVFVPTVKKVQKAGGIVYFRVLW